MWQIGTACKKTTARRASARPTLVRRRAGERRATANGR
jgi:hypothetical protein